MFGRCTIVPTCCSSPFSNIINCRLTALCHFHLVFEYRLPFSRFQFRFQFSNSIGRLLDCQFAFAFVRLIIKLYCTFWGLSWRISDVVRAASSGGEWRRVAANAAHAQFSHYAYATLQRWQLHYNCRPQACTRLPLPP